MSFLGNYKFKKTHTIQTACFVLVNSYPNLFPATNMQYKGCYTSSTKGKKQKTLPNSFQRKRNSQLDYIHWQIQKCRTLVLAGKDRADCSLWGGFYVCSVPGCYRCSTSLYLPVFLLLLLLSCSVLGRWHWCQQTGLAGEEGQLCGGDGSGQLGSSDRTEDEGSHG